MQLHLEKHLKTSYNIDMNDLGMLSASSAYRTSANSVYSSTKVSYVKDKQELSGAETSSSGLSSNDEINDEAIISDAAITMLAIEKGADKAEPKDKSVKEAPSDAPKFGKDLTPEQEAEVVKLKARDAEVKAHEQAHLSAASGINTSAPTYTYQTGPDGQKYAIGGEVSVSFSMGKDPAENIAKAETMEAAALAPAEPSGQDLSVAKEAEKIIAESKQQLAEQEKEKESEDTNNKSDKTDNIPKTGNSEDTPSIPTAGDKTVKAEETPTISSPKSTDELPSIGGVAKEEEPVQIGGTPKSDEQKPIDDSNSPENQPQIAFQPQKDMLPAGLIA